MRSKIVAKAEGVIRSDELLTLHRFGQRLGLREMAMRELRKAGLPTIRIVGRRFVSGRQAIEFLERYAGNEKNEQSENQGLRSEG